MEGGGGLQGEEGRFSELMQSSFGSGSLQCET